MLTGNTGKENHAYNIGFSGYLLLKAFLSQKNPLFLPNLHKKLVSRLKNTLKGEFSKFYLDNNFLFLDTIRLELS